MTEDDEMAVDDVLDERERHDLDRLTLRYEKLIEPGPLSKAGQRIVGIVPDKVKRTVGKAGAAIGEQELYRQAMEVIANGFQLLESQSAKLTISARAVTERVNKCTEGHEITSLEEICFARSYVIARLVNGERARNLAIAAAEGAATGAPGFAGIPFNLVLSTFCYYRAVQSVAMFYGYDVRGDNEELAIASEVFANAMAPSGVPGGMGDVIGKIMMISEAEAVKQAVKKGWVHMAGRGGVPLLIVQLRALANKAARKALENAGQKGIENVMFRSVFEQLGRRLTQNAVRKAVPVVSAVIGGLFDTAQMSRVVNYADIFYQKRFIMEKRMRQNLVESNSAGVAGGPRNDADTGMDA